MPTKCATSKCKRPAHRTLVRTWLTGTVTRQPLCSIHLAGRIDLLSHYLNLKHVFSEAPDGRRWKVLFLRLRGKR